MILDKFRLDGKVAIVTGAFTGIGQAIAIAFAEAGADIVGVGRNPNSETRNKIESIGRKFLEIKADLSTIHPIREIIEQTIKEFGKIDVLVNNAGTIRRTEALEFTEKDWDDVINLNLKTAFFLSQSVAKEFIKQGTGGKIINIASILSFQGGIKVSSYTASKSAIMGITRILANELAKFNINVNAIAPGYIITELTKDLRNDQNRYNEILSRIPAGRWGYPEDIQGTAVFLASDASNYINGYTIAVDGGWLAR